MSTKTIFHRSASRQKGAVLVEFAILIPFLLLLLAGITEIGYLYSQLDTLNKSVHRAARYLADPMISRPGGIKSPIDLTNLSAIANNLVIYGSTKATSTPLIPKGNTNITQKDFKAVNNHIYLTYEYRHEFIMGNLINTMCMMVGDGNCFPDNQYPLSASSVMRVEGG